MCLLLFRSTAVVLAKLQEKRSSESEFQKLKGGVLLLCALLVLVSSCYFNCCLFDVIISKARLPLGAK